MRILHALLLLHCHHQLCSALIQLFTSRCYCRQLTEEGYTRQHQGEVHKLQATHCKCKQTQFGYVTTVGNYAFNRLILLWARLVP